MEVDQEVADVQTGPQHDRSTQEAALPAVSAR